MAAYENGAKARARIALRIRLLRNNARRLARFWFTFDQPVDSRAYAAHGFCLMAFKYAVEATVLFLVLGRFFPPADFFHPVLSARMKFLGASQEWLGWAQFIWSLPFLWIAISMSVRRAANAGISPWWGLIILVPIANYLFMIMMCLMPTRSEQQLRFDYSAPALDANVPSVLRAVAISSVVGLGMVLLAVFVLGSYGSALFLGVPIVAGATSAFAHNHNHARSMTSTLLASALAVMVPGLVIMLFALEGAICLLMALPIALPVSIFGGLVGKVIADSHAHYRTGLGTLVLFWPTWGGIDRWLQPTPVHEVYSAVEIDAPQSVVWRNVIRFPRLAEPREWYFRLGIAYPCEARIDGHGTGAVRHCVFSTGAFVEPITVWNAPHRLAFAVTEQPAPMRELSPYEHVHAPHLEGYLRCRSGEFRLVELPGGRTRLEGRTWYELEMFPQGYWTLWTDAIIHRIHNRVLRHIQTISESDRQAEMALGPGPSRPGS